MRQVRKFLLCILPVQRIKFLHQNNAEPIAWLDSPNVLTEAAERVAEVKSIGLDVGIDFHGRLHKPMAKQLAKMLEPLRPLFIEGNQRRMIRLWF